MRVEGEEIRLILREWEWGGSWEACMYLCGMFVIVHVLVAVVSESRPEVTPEFDDDND